MKIPWHISLFSADGFQSLLGFIEWFDNINPRFLDCFQSLLGFILREFYEKHKDELTFQSLLGFILNFQIQLKPFAKQFFQSLLGFIGKFTRSAKRVAIITFNPFWDLSGRLKI